ncbi:type III secretion system chaperone [Erwinia tracheiphila]|uniref:Uncharacterized protein n=1 Tax=Erwinia tracheiphila TaxID=65700 RepID=A0A0M2KDN4_9GAMM|nr:type III secretion system chaperone [Erwinia tracheiphila]EOS95817.1 type III chaperone protein ShcA [Erwinia tracheiphila PSU-1]KKF37480.1 hypothetical protein SY86_22125 [Erwinia tracheiphila]UIA88884.1 type III secretion system chaperone [Erwinia tracheiphila]UIA97265.1 type III secretion system chaperone [Erwinia tracheiphila]
MGTRFYDTLLRTFSHKLGIPPLSLDKRGACDLIIDEDIPLRIQQDITSQRVLLIAFLGDMQDHLPQLLLEANIAAIRDNKPVIAADSRAKQYYASHMLEQTSVTADLLALRVGELAEHIRFWRDASRVK